MLIPFFRAAACLALLTAGIAGAKAILIGDQFLRERVVLGQGGRGARPGLQGQRDDERSELDRAP